MISLTGRPRKFVPKSPRRQPAHVLAVLDEQRVVEVVAVPQLGPHRRRHGLSPARASIGSPGTA